MTDTKQGGATVNIEKYRVGRNFIRIGDVVRVKAAPGKRNGFTATVRAIKMDERTRQVGEVEVFGGPAGRAMVRTFRRDRIERVAQSRNGQRRELPR
jgi:hypothetical protein